MKIITIKGHKVLLDNDDWLRLCGEHWKIQTRKDEAIYFCCNKIITLHGEKTRRTIYMHRAIMAPPYGLDLPKNKHVHHKNGFFDMRKEMLVILDKGEHCNYHCNNVNNEQVLPEKPNDDIPI